MLVLFRGISQDHSHDDSTSDKDDNSRPESVDNESLLDVEEVEDISSQDVNINEESYSKQAQESDTLTNANTTGESLTVSHKCTF